ncbi:hypothetical protein [Algoriphagus marinus]|uniref:hypothetical protein n=1 Tax=Algoriphagus marinus TaxID=1925762 RepID=UPI00094BBF23|nr:hypothetical protein [Algoriphagus marinus]
MTKTRRNFLRKVTAFSFLASIPGIGLSKNLFSNQEDFSSVTQIGGLNTSRFGLPHSADGLILSRRFSSGKDGTSSINIDSSSELVRLNVHSKFSDPNHALNEFSTVKNESIIEPISAHQSDLQSSNFLIRKIGGFKTGIIGLVLPLDSADFDKKVDQINGMVSQLKKEFNCQKVFCLIKTTPDFQEKTLVERFTRHTSGVSQVFCSLSYEDKKASVLKSIQNASGSSVLLSLNQYKNSDISEIGLSGGGLIGYSNH